MCLPFGVLICAFGKAIGFFFSIRDEGAHFILIGCILSKLCSLCQRLDSRQLTQIRAPEVRGKSSAKRERERRRRESPPEAKGERSEPFAGGARDSAKRNRVFVIMAKFLSPSSHVTCQNWIRPFTKKHRFIAQIDSARSNIASTA